MQKHSWYLRLKSLLWYLYQNENSVNSVWTVNSMFVNVLTMCHIGPLSIWAPCGFFGRFEGRQFQHEDEGEDPFQPLHWRMKMWRTHLSGLLKSEDYKLSHMSKMKTAFWKLVKTEDLKIPIKNEKKMKTPTFVGSPSIILR